MTMHGTLGVAARRVGGVIALGASLVGFFAFVHGVLTTPPRKAPALYCPAHCRPMQTLLRNRPIPPVHSFAKPFDICEEP